MMICVILPNPLLNNSSEKYNGQFTGWQGIYINYGFRNMSDDDKKKIRENVSILIRAGVAGGIALGKSEISYDQLESWVKEAEDEVTKAVIDSVEEYAENCASLLEAELRHQEFLRRLRVQAFVNNLLG